MFYYFFVCLITIDRKSGYYAKAISTKFFKFKMASQYCYGFFYFEGGMYILSGPVKTELNCIFVVKTKRKTDQRRQVKVASLTESSAQVLM